MKKRILYFLILLSFIVKAQNIPKVVSGSLQRIENFKSNYIGSRTIDIWFPENYNSQKKYAVMYMQDGQMLFDPTTTWNRDAWEADVVATKLMNENKVQDFIIVGISNGEKARHASYFPQKPFENLTQKQKNFVTQKLKEKGRITDTFEPNSDNYLRFLVTELKPYIDNTFSVYKDKSNTFIAGSSMGGLISIYAICEYPEVFGGAACLSTHWPGIFSLEDNPIPNSLFKYLKHNLPNPKNHKIYFDYGDQTLDALYPELQKKVDEIMKYKGFTEKNWVTKFFPGMDHSEKSWKERLNIPFEFLLKK